MNCLNPIFSREDIQKFNTLYEGKMLIQKQGKTFTVTYAGDKDYMDFVKTLKVNACSKKMLLTKKNDEALNTIVGKFMSLDLSQVSPAAVQKALLKFKKIASNDQHGKECKESITAIYENFVKEHKNNHVASKYKD